MDVRQFLEARMESRNTSGGSPPPAPRPPKSGPPPDPPATSVAQDFYHDLRIARPRATHDERVKARVERKAERYAAEQAPLRPELSDSHPSDPQTPAPSAAERPYRE